MEKATSLWKYETITIFDENEIQNASKTNLFNYAYQTYVINYFNSPHIKLNFIKLTLVAPKATAL